MLRYRQIQWRLIGKLLGMLLMVLAMAMATSILWSIYYAEWLPARSLASSSLIALFIGIVLWAANKRQDYRNISIKEGYLIVSLTWISMSVLGALPYFLSGDIASFTDACFESFSGFTTTGASILQDIESMPKSLLYWRSMTHWLGGMGIIVLTLSILPILGVGGMQLYVAEAPGTTANKLHPHMKDTARRLWGIYSLLTMVQTFMLMLGGMNFFHSLNHAFSTMATGGFSTQNDSIAGYSPYIQYVIILFMVLAGVSFTMHYFVVKGQFKRLLGNEELKFYLVVILTFTIIIAAALMALDHYGLEKAFRDGLFQVVSITTTTGFVTTDYLQWQGQLWIFLFLLMFTGGCIGSTGGGLKMIRVWALIKNTRIEIQRLTHPMAVLPLKMDGKVIQKNVTTNFLAFFFLYILVFFAGAGIMSIYGLDIESAFGASIATLGNIGPAMGSVGPVENYAQIPTGGKWVLSFFMLLGRLELFTVLLLFSPSFWKR